MLFKLCASWLVVMVLLPFTAPLSTFDGPALPRASRRTGSLPAKMPFAEVTRAVLFRPAPLPVRGSRLRVALDRLHAPDGAAVVAGMRATAGGFPTVVVRQASTPTVLRI